MRAVVQRVLQSSVSVDGEVIGEIGKGLMVLIGVTDTDTQKDIEYIAKKIVNLRVFDDENGVMNKSIIDYNYELLVISQFTLYGDARKGNRPSYIKAARPEFANDMYEKLIKQCQLLGVNPQKGKFQADMKVSLINDGPVTILLESE